MNRTLVPDNPPTNESEPAKKRSRLIIGLILALLLIPVLVGVAIVFLLRGSEEVQVTDDLNSQVVVTVPSNQGQIEIPSEPSTESVRAEVVLESPLDGQILSSPFTIMGTADVADGILAYRLTAGGEVLAEGSLLNNTDGAIAFEFSVDFENDCCIEGSL